MSAYVKKKWPYLILFVGFVLSIWLQIAVPQVNNDFLDQVSGAVNFIRGNGVSFAFYTNGADAQIYYTKISQWPEAFSVLFALPYWLTHSKLFSLFFVLLIAFAGYYGSLAYFFKHYLQSRPHWAFVVAGSLATSPFYLLPTSDTLCVGWFMFILLVLGKLFVEPTSTLRNFILSVLLGALLMVLSNTRFAYSLHAYGLFAAIFFFLLFRFSVKNMFLALGTIGGYFGLKSIINVLRGGSLDAPGYLQYYKADSLQFENLLSFRHNAVIPSLFDDRIVYTILSRIGFSELAVNRVQGALSVILIMFIVVVAIVFVFKFFKRRLFAKAEMFYVGILATIFSTYLAYIFISLTHYKFGPEMDILEDWTAVFETRYYAPAFLSIFFLLGYLMHRTENWGLTGKIAKLLIVISAIIGIAYRPIVTLAAKNTNPNLFNPAKYSYADHFNKVYYSEIEKVLNQNVPLNTALYPTEHVHVAYSTGYPVLTSTNDVANWAAQNPKITIALFGVKKAFADSISAKTTRKVEQIYLSGDYFGGIYVLKPE